MFSAESVPAVKLSENDNIAFPSSYKLPGTCKSNEMTAYKDTGKMTISLLTVYQICYGSYSNFGPLEPSADVCSSQVS